MISIVIPVYNVAPYIERCMRSILNQSKSDFEVILIDDGSTDESGTICDSFLHDSRVKVIHQPNGGTSTARNAGIEASGGEYVWFVDPDDWIAEDALSKVEKAAEGYDLLLCGANKVMFDENNNYRILPWVSYRNDLQNINAVKQAFYDNATLSNKIIKRQLIANERFRPGLRFGEDADFYHRILNSSMKVQVLPESVYFYHFRRNGNTVSGLNDDRSLDYLDSAKNCYFTLSQKGWPMAGMKRMMVVINQVTGKISPEQSLRDQSVYMRKIR